MKLGIVGAEAAKFTPETEAAARASIREAIEREGAKLVISGGCHLGGVDIWAIEEAHALGIETLEFIPKHRRWKPDGYQARNEQIARESDMVLCMVVRNYPPGYEGMRFDGCYHCRGRVPPHVKSGGCWTAWKCSARRWCIL